MLMSIVVQFYITCCIFLLQIVFIIINDNNIIYGISALKDKTMLTISKEITAKITMSSKS